MQSHFLARYIGFQSELVLSTKLQHYATAAPIPLLPRISLAFWLHAYLLVLSAPLMLDTLLSPASNWTDTKDDLFLLSVPVSGTLSLNISMMPPQSCLSSPLWNPSFLTNTLTDSLASNVPPRDILLVQSVFETNSGVCALLHSLWIEHNYVSVHSCVWGCACDKDNDMYITGADVCVRACVYVWLVLAYVCVHVCVCARVRVCVKGVGCKGGEISNSMLFF